MHASNSHNKCRIVGLTAHCADFTDSTCVHPCMWTARTDPVCASGPLKHKKLLCIISWGGGRERQSGGVWSRGRGRWPSPQPSRWPHSQHTGILCLPPLFLDASTILPFLFLLRRRYSELALSNPFKHTAHSFLPAPCGFWCQSFLLHMVLNRLFVSTIKA